MCAIAGVIGLICDDNAVLKMMHTMLHRGPDGNGCYSDPCCTLLHTRLAIIDLEGGRQPMELQWAGEHYVISYNGEIYNTEEVRSKLCALGHRFHGHSDTEVVLHAYAQWGEAALHQLNGIFAFGVWEKTRKRLFLARDRMGVKPLFYMKRDDGLLFASEIKTILAYPGVEAQLDANGIGEIFLLGPGRTPGSGVFRGIYEIESGCCGYFENGKLHTKQYWHLADREHRESFDETAEEVRYLVQDAIKRQMVSDVPIGTFLSGGLDSSIISAVCAGELAKQGKKLDTFSVDYRNNDKYFRGDAFQPTSDASYIQVMTQTLGSRQHDTMLSSQNLVDALADATVARDLPGMADVDFSLLAFCREIRSHVKVGLSGECADEIFGGYPWYRDPKVRAVDGFPWAQNTAYRASMLKPDALGTIDPMSFVQDRYRQSIAEADILPRTSDEEKRMKQLVYLNQRWFMQTLLDRKDRMSMYCGLEVRVPFCDHRIAEYLYGVPWEYKDHNGYEKGLLRSAMNGLLPDSVLWRKKSPYPKTYDPGYLHIVSSWLKRIMEDTNAPLLQLVRREALEQLLTAEYTWPWYGQLMKVPQTIAYMLQIDYWLRKYRISLV